MPNLNKVLLMGNLTRDPELRYTPSGAAVVEFGMAINRQWKGQDGQKKEEVTFVDVMAWQRTAEIISEYCKKGSPLFVEGRLQLDTWEGKDGQKRSRMRVVVDNMQLLGSPGGRRAPAEGGPAAPPSRNAPPARKPAPAAAPAQDAPPPPDVEPPPPAEGSFKVDDDIPF
jgi:single-strand DNA-binding protein